MIVSMSSLPALNRSSKGISRLGRPIFETDADLLDKRFRAEHKPVNRSRERRREPFVKPAVHKRPVAATAGGSVAAEIGQHAAAVNPLDTAADVARIAAPLPVFRPWSQPCPHRIQMHIAADFEPVAFGFDQNRFETALEKMARAAVPGVEVAGVPADEIVHPGRQVGLLGLQEEVEMVVQQGEGEHPPTISSGRALQAAQPRVAIAVVTDDRPPLDAPRGDVVDGVGKLDAQRSCHDAHDTLATAFVKTID